MKPIKKKRKSITTKYRDKNADKLKEYDRAREQIKVYCPHCNGEIVKNS